MNGQNWKTRLLSVALVLVMLLADCTVVLAQEDGAVSYGRVNLDKVRFRKTASLSGEWWCYLDTDWVVEISDETGDFYKVRCNIPDNIDRNYIGYLMKDYVDVMDANEQVLWLQNPVQPSGDPAYTSAGAAVVTPTQAAATSAPAPTTSAPSAEGTPLPSNGSYGRVADDDVFFRQAPGSDIYWAKLPKGWLLEVLSVAEPDADGVVWYQVQGGIPSNVNGNYKGYIHGDYFTLVTDAGATNAPVATVAPTAAPAATQVPDGTTWGRINKDKVFFRKTASTSADYWCYLYTGWTLQVVDTVKDKDGSVTWYKVKGGIPANPDNTYTGYIMNDFLDVVSSDQINNPTATPVPGTQQSGYGMITVTGTNVRETAADNGTAVTALSMGAIVQITGVSGNYTKIKYETIEGYVPTANLRALTQAEYDQQMGVTQAPTTVPTTAPTAAPGTSTGVLGYIELVKGGVNLRKTPNGSSLTPTSDTWLPKELVLPYYAEAVKAGGYWWIYVNYNGTFGYIRSDCYKITSTVTDATPTQAPSIDLSQAKGYIRLTKGGVNLRDAANLSSNIYGRENKDTVLPYFATTVNESTKTTWYYVYSQAHQVYGYISGDFTALCNQDGSDVTGDAIQGQVTGYAVTTANKVYVRSATSTSSKMLGQVAAKGTILDMWGDPITVGQVQWIPVTYEGVSGYIHGNYAYQLAQWQLDQYYQTGALPTPTASPSPAPTGDSSYIVITDNSVWVRSGAGTSYAPVSNTAKVHTGDVFQFTKVIDGSPKWYRILYNGSIAYIHGNYARVMTNMEYLQWKESQTPALNPTATPSIDIDVPDTFNTLRLGSSGDEVKNLQLALYALGYLEQGQVTGEYLSTTVDAVKAFQKAQGLTVDGVAGKTTQTRLYALISGGNNDGSSVDVTLYPVEKSDWFTGDIQKVWARGETAVVTDVYTGISFRARRWAGGYHADVEPLTATDTAAICRIFKVDEAIEIADREDELQSWRRRPLWVTIDGRTFAASMYGVPHNFVEGDTIEDNNYPGQFCIHFTNSMTHKGDEVDYPRPANGYFSHQNAIDYAYKNSISGTK